MLRNKKRILILGCMLTFVSILILLNNIKQDKFNIDKVKLEIQIDSRKNIKIPIKKISFLYDELTQGMDLNNETDIKLLKFQLDRIDPQFIYSNNDDIYFIVNYNCGVKLCNYMLVKYNETTIESIYLNSGLLNGFNISTNKDKVLINFIQPVAVEVYNEVVLVDINNMKIIDLPNLPKAYTYKVDSYNWEKNKYIIKYKEKDNEEIEVLTSE